MAKQCIGLDIGSSSVKAVQLKRSSSSWALQAFGMQPLVPQTIVDGTIMDQSAVAEAIRSSGAGSSCARRTSRSRSPGTR